MSSESCEVIKKDFLVKRAQLKSFFTKANYKSRWFELTETVLRYSTGTKEEGVGRTKGFVQLADIKNVEEADKEHLGCRPFAFQVVYKEDEGERNFLYIFAQNELQRKEWISAVYKAALKSGASLNKLFHPGVWLKDGKYSCCFSINKRSEGCQPSQTPHKLELTNGIYGDGTQEKPPFIDRPLPSVPSQSSESVGSQIVLALFDYHAFQHGDLSLVKGEEYELLEEPDPSSRWWMVKNKQGQSGHIPANLVKPVTGDCLDQYDWYYPKLSRYQSEELLMRDGREGVFLVRDSSQLGLYTLSIFTKAAHHESSMVKHYLIKRTSGGFFYVAENHVFRTIPELVYYHRHNCAGLIVRLRFPVVNKDMCKPTCDLGHNLKEIDYRFIDIKEELGKGQFGLVYKAIYVNEIEVAVKMMCEEALENDLLAEAETMMKLQHDNLVKLYGVCTKMKPIRIVTEYLKNGDLLKYLQKNKMRLSANKDKLLDMCLDVANGMGYLEHMNIIHRDLAARNCLVDAKGSVKVGDFGLARYVLDNEYMSSAGTKFPVRWSAPEVLNFNRFSSKSDVWAFGILMWEIYTCGDTPYGKKKNMAVVREVCSGELTLDKPQICSDLVYDIMRSCWHLDPDDRPNFITLYNQLHELLKEREYDD